MKEEGKEPSASTGFLKVIKDIKSNVGDSGKGFGNYLELLN